jgi:hypothetical protein
VTAVDPLQKQSTVGCNLSSLSIDLKALKYDCFSGRNISGSFSFSSLSTDSTHSSSTAEAASSELILPEMLPF